MSGEPTQGVMSWDFGPALRVDFGNDGVAEVVFGPEAAMPTTDARTLAAGSPTALAFTKRSLNHWLRAAWPAFEHSLALEIMGFAGADAREGLAALNEKRSPRFGGA